MISRIWHGARARLRRAFRGESETAEEIGLHVDLLADRYRASGLAPAEAQRQAALAFGNPAAVHENLRDRRPGFSAELWRRDFAQAFRFLVRHPGFGAVTVLSFALALGANIAIFSLLDALLFKPLAVREPQRLALFWWAIPKGTDLSVPTMGWWERDEDSGESTCASFPDLAFEQLARADSGLAEAFAFAPLRDLIVQHEGEAESVLGLVVSGNYFRGLGAECEIGRPLLPEDEARRDPVIVISHALWERRFGRAPDAVGRTLLVNQTAFTIVGVARRDFTGTVNAGDRADLYVPLALAGTLRPGLAEMRARGVWWLRIMGRLEAGATLEQVAARAATPLARGLEDALKAFPPPGGGTRENIVVPAIRTGPGAQGLGEARRAHRTQLVVLAALGLLVLGIACVNVANLLLARGLARQREVAVKLALGASRWRVLRQFLIESLVIAASGAALGLVLAVWFKKLLLLVRTGGGGQLAVELPVDGRVVLFTVGVTLLCALLAGAWPAWRNARVDPAEGFRTGPTGGARRPLGSVLLVVQMALSVVLIVCSALFLRTVMNLRSVDVGFDPDRILLVAADGTRAGLSPEAARDLYARLTTRLNQLPGVERASYAVIAPLSRSGWNGVVQVPGRPEQTGRDRLSLLNAVGADFFATFGIPVLRGRALDERDLAPDRLTAVVNESFVRRYFGQEDPVGRSAVVRGGEGEKTYEIVGVVRDTLYHDVRAPVGPILFVGFQHGFASEVTFALRTRGDAAALAPAVRGLAAELEPKLALTDFRTQEAQIEQLSSSEAVFAALAVVFGVLAVFLTCVGVYGLCAYRAARRTTEFGVRLALGAPRGSILWLVWREGVLLALLGVAGGSAAAWAAVRVVESNLYGVASRDLLSFAVGGLVVVVVGTLAAMLPAWRAMRIAPAACLRTDG